MVKRFEEYQISALRSAFKQCKHLTKPKKTQLVMVTGLDVEQITAWFNRNRAQERARKSKGNLEETKAELQRVLKLLDESQEREAQLQEDLQEMKTREAGLRAENRRLRNERPMVGGDSTDSQLDYFWSDPHVLPDGFNSEEHSSS